jgi:FdhD protein
VGIARLADGAFSSRADVVATEEPLEIRIAGDTFAVTMRTPGNDRELVLGLLFSEGVLSSVDDVGSIAHCGKTGDEARENTIDVTPAPLAKLALPDDLPGRRGTLTTSACGVCGRQTIDDLLKRCGPLPSGPRIAPEAVSRAVASIGDSQSLFRQTGGAHGAMLTTADGVRVTSFEDVGRHNAVDKVVGAMLLERKLPLGGHILVVSGRASFELVQKAVLAGIPVLASVSAPSSLAVELAARMNLTLCGFVRGATMNVYSGVDRLA